MPMLMIPYSQDAGVVTFGIKWVLIFINMTCNELID